MVLNKLSVAAEHRTVAQLCQCEAKKHLSAGIRLYNSELVRFRLAMERDLLVMTSLKLQSIFGIDYASVISVKVLVSVNTLKGNTGRTDFTFDAVKPKLMLSIHINKDLRTLYKTNGHKFCLTMADIYTHELLHSIQYVKQYYSLGTRADLLRDSIFKGKEYLFKHDIRFKKRSKYYEDLPYFSKHEELVCYAKDAARELLTEYQNKKIIFTKLSNTAGLKELSDVSLCFYYYYDCFTLPVSEIPQYRIIWQRFIKHLCHNLNEDFSI